MLSGRRWVAGWWAPGGLALAQGLAWGVELPVACPSPLHAVVLDVADARTRPEEAGIRALLDDIIQAVMQRAGVRVETASGPVARVVRDFRQGPADLTLISSEALGPGAPVARAVPMARLTQVAWRAARAIPAAPAITGSAPSPAPFAWGALHGVPIPAHLPHGESLTRVGSYRALFKLLESGRVEGIVGFRPTLDLYLRHEPAQRALLGDALVLGELQTALQLSQRLPAECVTRLANAAEAVRREVLPSLLRRHLGHAEVETFLMP